MLVMVLEQADMRVQSAVDTQQAAELLRREEPDLIVLDWMLPGVSGVEWAKRLKKDELYQELPVLMLTARGEVEDKLRAFNVGADDYVTKPFSPRELIARIHAILRRAGKLGKVAKITAGPLSLDPVEHRVTLAGAEVAISPTEYRLLEFFLTHPGKVYSRTQLLDQVWGRSTYIEERTVDVHIRRLRKILGEYSCEDLIQTVRGFGYRFSTAE
jgi:two-component system phosphate regulon response regulator PhoB